MIEFDMLHDYDKNMDLYYFTRRAERLKQYVTRQSKEIKILDLGCGSGNFTAFLKGLDFKRIYGIDISRTLLKMAANRNGKLILADGEKLPCGEKTYDLIIMMDILEHLRTPIEVLKEVHRVLKNEGTVFITYPNPKMVPLLNLLSAAGLKIRTKENKVYLDDMKEFPAYFEIEVREAMILASKLPSIILKFLEKLEAKLPTNVLNTIGFCYLVILKKVIV